MTYRIYPLRNGRCVIAGNHAFRGGDPSERYEYRLFAWLILGGRRPMLADAGLANVEEMNLGAAHVLAEPITQSPDEQITAQLSEFGLLPEDIGHVFITHLHFDHVDQLDLYKNATIVVSKRGLEAATAFPGWRGSWAPAKTLIGLTERWRDRVLAIDDSGILPGIETVWLGGHTPCSQGILVRTQQGRTLLGGDTISLWANLERNIPVGVAHDYHECLTAMKKAREIADLVLPSHDPAVLDRFPEGV